MAADGRAGPTDHVDAFYRETLDALGARVCRFRVSDLTVRYCNDEWAAPFGAPPERLVGRCLAELISPDELAALERQVPVALRSGTLTGSETTRPGPHGTVVVETWVDRALDGPDGPEILTIGRDITRLAEAEAESSFLAENTTEVLMRVGLDRRVRFVTPAIAPMLEFEPGDIVGAPLEMLIVPEHRHLLATAVDDAIRTGSVQRCELAAAAMAPDVTVWSQLSVTSVLSETGAVELHVALRDIAEERRLRDELLAGRARLSAIIDAVPSGILAVDADRRVLAMNRTASSLYGMSLLPGATISELRHGPVQFQNPDGTPMDSRTMPLTRAMAEQGVATGEAVFHAVDGSGDVPVAILGRAWTDDGGATAGAVVVMHDMSETRRAQAALARGEEQFRSLAEGSPIPVLTMTSDANVDYANDALCRLLGVTSERILDRGWYAFIPDDDRATLRILLDHALQGGEETRVEHAVRTATGSRRWVSTTFRPTDDASTIIVTIVDLTERRVLEEQLAHDATHDALTGLANRAQLLDRLDQSLRRLGRTGDPPTLAFCDLDRFKPVNDRHGHAAGDQVLVTVAERLQRSVRTGDTVARLGGDEFVVLAEPPIGPEDAAALAQRLIDCVEERIELADGTSVSVGVSIGLARAEIGDDARELLARADAAVYAAKRAGRGCAFRSDPAGPGLHRRVGAAPLGPDGSPAASSWI